MNVLSLNVNAQDIKCVCGRIEKLDNKTQQVHFSNLWEIAKEDKINST